MSDRKKLARRLSILGGACFLLFFGIAGSVETGRIGALLGWIAGFLMLGGAAACLLTAAEVDEEPKE